MPYFFHFPLILSRKLTMVIFPTLLSLRTMQSMGKKLKGNFFPKTYRPFNDSCFLNDYFVSATVVTGTLYSFSHLVVTPALWVVHYHSYHFHLRKPVLERLHDLSQITHLLRVRADNLKPDLSGSKATHLSTILTDNESMKWADGPVTVVYMTLFLHIKSHIIFMK